MRQVPELSLLSYVNGTSADQVKFVDQITRGLKDYGFITLTDHTVAQDKVDKAYAVSYTHLTLPTTPYV